MENHSVSNVQLFLSGFNPGHTQHALSFLVGTLDTFEETRSKEDYDSVVKEAKELLNSSELVKSHGMLQVKPPPGQELSNRVRAMIVRLINMAHKETVIYINEERVYTPAKYN